MEEIPDTQKAWVVVRRGTPSQALELKTDWPVPKELAEGEVLVKVQAAALNPIGSKLMKTLPNFIAKRPHVAEQDFSGVVVDGNGTNFSKGNAVYGWIPSKLQQKTRQGTLAEYLRLPVNAIVARPACVTPIQASGITLTCLTSYQALIQIGKLEAEQTVFINGGSTALGAFAIQIAKAKGAKVVATASGKNEKFVRNMGANEFIDYTKTGPLYTYLSQNAPSTKYHIFYDAIGLLEPSLFSESPKYLAPGGIFISSGPMPENLSASEIWKICQTLAGWFIPSWLGGVSRRYTIVMVKHNEAEAKEVQQLLENGSVKPIVDFVYDFNDALKAYDRMLTKRATGKIVVKVDPSVD